MKRPMAKKTTKPRPWTREDIRVLKTLAREAFVSPVFMAAIADGNAPADLTVTGLARAVPHSWVEQQRCLAAVGPSGS